jgi:hypothetical protein
LVVGFVTVFDSQIVVFDIYIQVREDEFFFDEFPNDTGHFVAIKLHDGIRYFNFLHVFGFKRVEVAILEAAKIKTCAQFSVIR